MYNVMVDYFLIAKLLVFILFFSLTRGQSPGEYSNETFLDFRNEGYFKIIIPPRSSECFYTTYNASDTAYMSYEVVDGGDRRIDFTFKNAVTNLPIVKENENSASDFKEYTFKEQTEIEYCFKNLKTSFQKKVVSIAMFRTMYRKMTLQNQRDRDAFDSVNNFTERFQRITMHITNITMILQTSGSQSAFDFFYMKRNLSYVQFWAILHVIIIVVTSLIQVFFLRSFFRETSVHNQKQRA